MARDRLAALRAQQGGSYNTDSLKFNSNSYPSAPQTRRPNPYARQDDDKYEMSDVHAASNDNLTVVGVDSMSAFYDEISSIQDSIRKFTDNIEKISDLHSRSLNNMDDQAAQRNVAQLDKLIESTSSLSNELKLRIKSLERQGGSGRDGTIRKQQTGVVKQKFVEAIQQYQTVEQQYRQKYKQRMERQFKIVKPDATPEEVRAVVNDDQGGQIFSQALMSSNRYGESRAAYREVQERHEDIKKIERTLVELAQLFNDMSILVEQQDDQINTIEATTEHVEKDLEQGLNYTEKAVTSARAARKKRWICFFIILGEPLWYLNSFAADSEQLS
ncbi:t-SNARE [Sistotremastrum niveocremeum HHB9708]|uniref:t-SNARE n=1 Tax=Sistotremastrum niveocremeum HHB9708 TaxID=1314777 RepID=A0A165AIU6_9AGAM|nr:t-SNARE [Sistotremastrum niveocremeum HHB9708]